MSKQVGNQYNPL